MITTLALTPVHAFTLILFLLNGERVKNNLPGIENSNLLQQQSIIIIDDLELYLVVLNLIWDIDRDYSYYSIV